MRRLLIMSRTLAKALAFSVVFTAIALGLLVGFSAQEPALLAMSGGTAVLAGLTTGIAAGILASCGLGAAAGLVAILALSTMLFGTALCAALPNAAGGFMAISVLAAILLNESINSYYAD